MRSQGDPRVALELGPSFFMFSALSLWKQLTAQTRLPPGKHTCNQYTGTLYVSLDHSKSRKPSFSPSWNTCVFWLTLKADLRLKHNNTIFYSIISSFLDFNFKDTIVG